MLSQLSTWARQHRILRRAIAFGLGIVFALLSSLYRPVSASSATEILWDTYGVPHIRANNPEDLFYSFGWAQMHNHGDLMLRLYAQARGRAAEYWGGQYLDADRWVRTVGIPQRARVWYDEQTPEFRRYLDAFAAGVNAYARDRGDRIADEVKAVLPVTPVDLLAHLQQVLHFTFVVNPFQVQGLVESSQRQAASVPRGGSNAWAIAPSRSSSGNAMLLANPHLMWSERFLWHEAQLSAPGIDTYGVSLVGMPVLNIAFNDRLGWTHTINTFDGWDLYALDVVGDGYRWDGEIRQFETETQTLKVRQADGSLSEELLEIKRSRHGPVVLERDNAALALRVVGLDRPRALEQWWQMGRAGNLAEFETALEQLQIPMFSVIYADRDGHILHLFNGQVPVRSGGDFADWQGILPGNAPELLWNDYHPYNDLPRLLDPTDGWLQNANDPPWTTTIPPQLDPEDYPSYLAPPGPMQLRAQQSARLLVENERISFEELIANKHSTRMAFAERILDDLQGAIEQYGTSLAREAMKVLNDWDRRANKDSRGAVLFAVWAQALQESNVFARPWDPEHPLSTPDGLSDPALAAATLEQAAARVTNQYGRLDVAWGEVFRLRLDDIDLPASGGPGELGIFRVFEFEPDSDGKFRATQGDSYVAAIEFSDPVRAKVLTSYGNATQPDSPHRGDGLSLLSEGKLHPAWRSRSQVLSHLEARDRLRR